VWVVGRPAVIVSVFWSFPVTAFCSKSGFSVIISTKKGHRILFLCVCVCVCVRVRACARAYLTLHPVWPTRYMRSGSRYSDLATGWSTEQSLLGSCRSKRILLCPKYPEVFWGPPSLLVSLYKEALTPGYSQFDWYDFVSLKVCVIVYKRSVVA
jgi:hypothetical protein